MSENFLTVPLQIYSDTVSEASTDGDLEYQDLSIRNPSYKHKKLNHSSNPNQKMKTSLCRKFSETGYCPYGTKCQFAHGLAELRCVTDENKYKTKSCHSFSRKGFCQYGPRCNFVHNTAR